MTTLPIRLGPLRAGSVRPADAGAAAAVAAAGWLAYEVTVLHGGSVTLLAAVAGAVTIAWMLVTSRTDVALCVLVLYLGLLDGFLRLKTGDGNLTVARDGVLYAIAAGALVRAAVRRDSFTLPPLSGWVLAFVAVVLVQVANPQATGLLHTLAAVRPHLEFIPLFFLGYRYLRTTRALRVLLVLFLVVAAANGVVSLVQFNLKPEQLAAWGSGYAERINGTGDLAARLFWDDSGDARVRPFGLGSDSGVGGAFGLVAVAPVLALLALGRRRREAKIALLLSFGPILAIATSQGRSVLLASVFAALVYVVLTTSARHLIPTVSGLLVVGVVGYLVVSSLAGSAGSGVFDRYKTLSPDRLLASTQESRGGSISRFPSLLESYPLGGGIGSVGPASRFAGGGELRLNGETEPNFLVSELGVPGLLVMALLNLHLLALAVRRLRRVPDPQARVLIAAIAATLAGFLLTWASAAPTSTVPGAPYLWFAAGALSWWLCRRS